MEPSKLENSIRAFCTIVILQFSKAINIAGHNHVSQTRIRVFIIAKQSQTCNLYLIDGKFNYKRGKKKKV